MVTLKLCPCTAEIGNIFKNSQPPYMQEKYLIHVMEKCVATLPTSKLRSLFTCCRVLFCRSHDYPCTSRYNHNESKHNDVGWYCVKCSTCIWNIALYIQVYTYNSIKFQYMYLWSMLYGDIDLSQPWFRYCLVAWRHQVITWAHFD